MEQIKEVLKYKFWILLGVGLIMTFTGWWMATGALAATIKTRKEVLSKVEGSIPSSPATIPNDRWSTDLSKINDQQQALVTAAARELWERQQVRMFWPPTVDEFAKQIPLRGEFPTNARELYRQNYPLDAERIWKIVRPVSKFDGSGIVEFPGVRFPRRIWGELAPTSAEMWDAQEDLWLVEPILEAIRDLNGDENATRLDAAVYSIERLELVGGQRGQPIDAPAAGAGGDAMSGFSGDAGAMSMSTMRGSGASSGMENGAMGGGSLAGAKFAQVVADFNYKEEFGDGGDPPWKGSTGNRGNMGGMAGMSAMSGMAEGGDAGGGAAASNYRRYVDDDPALPFKTRGFYMTVVMDHRRVPELIAALTANGKSDWPIEVVRVQVARLNSDDSEGPVPGGGGMGPNMGLAGENYGASGLAEAGASGFGGAANYEGMPSDGLGGAGAAATGFASELVNPNQDQDGLPNVRTPNQNAIAFQNVLRDPFVAKVALCGLIYIYNPPPAAPETPPAEAPPAEQPAPTEAVPGETPAVAAESMPADGADPAATSDPAKDPTPSEPAPAATTPPDSEKPQDPASPQPEAGTAPPN